MTWAERIKKAVDAWSAWDGLPLEPRMDRVFKESGVRDLIVEIERLQHKDSTTEDAA